MNENEKIREKNRKSERLANENIRTAVTGDKRRSGINAILKYLNAHTRLESNLSDEEQLERLGELNINTRGASLEKDFYKKSVLPMLAETVDGDWLAVLPHSGGGCSYIKNGKKTVITAKNAGIFSGNALYFYKNTGSEKITEKSLIKFILDCVSAGNKIIVILLAALAVLAGMLLPWANSYIFARIVPSGVSSGALSTAALILSAVLTATIMKLIQSYVTANSVIRVSAYVQNSIIMRLLRIKTGFFKTEKSGELSNMIMRFSDISEIISAQSVTACITGVLSVVYLCQMRTYAPQLFGTVIAITAVYAAWIVADGFSKMRYNSRYSDTLSEMSGFTYEMFSGMEQIKLGGAEMTMLRRWSEKYVSAADAENPPFIVKYSGVIYKLLSMLSLIPIFILGSELSAAEYIAFSAALGSYTAAIMSFGSVIDAAASFKSAYNMISPLLSAELEDRGAKKQRPPKLCGAIDVSDLSFRYNKDMPYVVDKMSFSVKQGESVGIVGTSGCGKSTLLRLLLGFETADEGSIYIDGFDLRELDLTYYRKSIGTVMQTAGLISGDIYSNIVLTKPDADLSEVEEAVEAAGLARDIAALPLGLHTPISEENCTLSGGQRQRILIARAIISKPAILILDEATSALDNVTQAHITRSINALDCTKIIVAHRLSTVRECDRILVLDKGKIAESGTFEELSKADGLFKKMLSRQVI
ncbi:MAG: ATP-binding cassette domain-containing protein [Oscillospiraceae bacterium]|nr:ATP-binding cassette domain-containing protein [Oscillospiraceae bacterium]